MILHQKLYNIDKNGIQTISKSFKLNFKLNKNQREEYVKKEIKVLDQAKLFILKKLLNKNSENNASKFENNINNHKKNICYYPVNQCH